MRVRQQGEVSKDFLSIRSDGRLSPLTKVVLQGFLCNGIPLPVRAGAVYRDVGGGSYMDRQVFDGIVRVLVDEGYLSEVRGRTSSGAVQLDRGCRFGGSQREAGALWNGVYWKR